ncbi:MAG TPA: ABC transporter ATP-binding protein [Acidimicrobiales bacterium]|nr:ABC transporter ATP-binding protein [Acidimicrobiales bacterium]
MSDPTSTSAVPQRSEGPTLQAVALSKHFPMHRGGRGGNVGPRRVVHAVDNINLSLYSGEITALVGESGSGKSTVARVLTRLYPPTSGEIFLGGSPARARHGRAFRRYLSDVQMVFQDPFSSLNAIHTVEYQLSRPLKNYGVASSRRDVADGVASLLEQVNLTPPGQFSEKYPHELSGGQLQRVAVARALAARPKVLLADEPVSMLDVSIRLGVLNLLAQLVDELDLALLYITHDIASARYFAKDTLVMYAGQLVEGGPSELVIQEPSHPYTKLLVSSAPDPRRRGMRTEAGSAGEPPSLINPPKGCRFHPRCPFAMPVCSQEQPPLTNLDRGTWVRCWLHADAAHGAPGSGSRPAPNGSGGGGPEDVSVTK